MVHSLTPWTQLTRFGIPAAFTVIRRALPFNSGGEARVLIPGEQIPDGLLDRRRLKQLYEQRRIFPVGVPDDPLMHRLREKAERLQASEATLVPESPAPATPLAHPPTVGTAATAARRNQLRNLPRPNQVPVVVSSDVPVEIDAETDSQSAPVAPNRSRTNKR